MSVYTIGEGWTGALGTGSLESFAAGHDDEEPDEPFLVHDGPVSSAAAGWGHTAFVSNGELFLCGRPQELSTLLRLKRFPHILRMYAVNHALRYNHDEHDEMVTTSPSFAGKIIQWLVGGDEGPDGSWAAARKNSLLTTPTVIPLPNSQRVSLDSSKSLDASAGLTALLSESGQVYTFGMNHNGQCGIGMSSTNVWTPERVVGLSSNFASEGRENLDQEYPISQIAVGLQHGVALNTAGHVYVWGKAERGQLGLKDNNNKPFFHHAVRTSNFRVQSTDGSHLWSEDVKITSISAGMNHTAARSEDNTVFIWGKNVAQPSVEGRMIQDSHVPVPVKGLPKDKEVLDISCGSHHTAILLEDGSVYAIGVATDDAKPVLEAIQLIPPGVVDTPVRQFKAHFDRTTIVGKNGDQVLQAHLWSNEDLRKNAAFTPTWIDHISHNVKSVHRGWLHTVVVTDDN